MKDDNQSESHSIDGLPHSDGDGNSSDASDDELSLTVELQQSIDGVKDAHTTGKNKLGGRKAGSTIDLKSAALAYYSGIGGSTPSK